MGLNRNKPILLRNGFKIDPLYPQNAQLSQDNKSTLPNLENDVMLDKRQSVYYSVEYVLKKLLDNDRFIDNYMQKSKNQLNYVTQERLLSAISSTNVQTSSANDIYERFLSSHIKQYHTDTGYVLSTVTQDFIKTDMSNFDKNGAISAFQHIENKNKSMSLSNDIVVNVEFSEDVNRSMNYVNVNVCNKMTNGQFRNTMNFDIDMLAQIPSLTSTTYIYKEWLSGIKELYVHIPTTFTMYNENENALDSEYWSYENVAKNITLIQVKINKRHFNFNNIYQAYICGQSLPLQIHNESSYSYFSDVIQPSILKTMCVQPTNSENNVNCIYDENQATYTLYFTCYGTDEQAIRIFGN